MQAELGIIRYAPQVIDFSTAFTRGLPHGILAAIHLPSTTDDLPSNILHRLHTDERTFAETLSSRRRIEWVGGRLAARVAASALGTDLSALLTDEHGAPKAPKGLSVSISHKSDLALALVARKKNGSIGVDFEHLDRDRAHIAPKILRPMELQAVDALHEERRWNGVLLRFAMKEAITRPLHPDTDATLPSRRRKCRTSRMERRASCSPGALAKIHRRPLRLDAGGPRDLRAGSLGLA